MNKIILIFLLLLCSFKPHKNEIKIAVKLTDNGRLILFSNNIASDSIKYSSVWNTNLTAYLKADTVFVGYRFGSKSTDKNITFPFQFDVYHVENGKLRKVSSFISSDFECNYFGNNCLLNLNNGKIEFSTTNISLKLDYETITNLSYNLKRLFHQ